MFSVLVALHGGFEIHRRVEWWANPGDGGRGLPGTVSPGLQKEVPEALCRDRSDAPVPRRRDAIHCTPVAARREHAEFDDWALIPVREARR